MRWVVTFALVVGCGDDGMVNPLPDAPPPDADQSCPPVTGAGTEHQGTIGLDETWTAAASPHILTFNVSVQNATLTIEPCAVVRIRKGFTITIGANTGPSAALVAQGESVGGTIRGITFERADAAMPWGSIRAFPTGRIDFEHVHLSGGADPDTAQNGGGSIVASGNGGNMGTTANLRVVDVTVEGSAGFGVNLVNRSVFTADSANLVITGAGTMPGTNMLARYPLAVEGPAVSTVPTGTYTGNAIDAIRLSNSSSLLDSTIVFPSRGVPYQIADSFSMAPQTSVAAGGLSTLTIEAGVTIKFSAGGPANIWAMTLGSSNGALPVNIFPVRVIAQGTAAQPIVLTSSAPTPAAGDWGGIEWRGGAATGNVMSHVRIEYAGGDSGSAGFGCGEGDNDAALIIANWRPDDVFITDSTISDSAAGGIVSGWQSDLDGPSLVSNNTFTNVASCRVSRWRNGNGTCPGTPPVCL
ncbi:MAG: hypothetical protein ACKV2T_07825 [Kofleriaceae bacterium]